MRYTQASHSHSPQINAILSDVPSGITIDLSLVARDLELRRNTYGRSERQLTETDNFQLLSGLYQNVDNSTCTYFDSKLLLDNATVDFAKNPIKTTGGPISILIDNNNLSSSWENEHVARPNHADFTTCKKFHLSSCELAAEGASARSTACLVAAGSIAMQFLSALNINILAFTSSIGQIEFCDYDKIDFLNYGKQDYWFDLQEINNSKLACLNEEFENALMREIDIAKQDGVTLGGTVKLIAFGLPVGLGSSYDKDKNLKSQIGAALLSLPSLSGIEFGAGFEGAALTGMQYADQFSHQDSGEFDIYAATQADNSFIPKEFLRASNNCGGIEGGISTSMPLELTLAVKPIPTVDTALNSIDVRTNMSAQSSNPRHDTCIVPSMCYIAKAQLAITLANAIQDKFGHDSFEDILQAVQQYNKKIL